MTALLNDRFMFVRRTIAICERAVADDDYDKYVIMCVLASAFIARFIASISLRLAIVARMWLDAVD